jgi:hypothetical protein
MAEMAAAKTIVVLWCSMATASQWVNKEAREAKRTQKYLPCRIESTALPKEFAAADKINSTEWDGAPRSHMLDRLVAEIARRLGRDPAPSFNQLRELNEDWRGFGAPSLPQFALGKAQTPDPPAPPPPRIPSGHDDLGAAASGTFAKPLAAREECAAGQNRSVIQLGLELLERPRRFAQRRQRSGAPLQARRRPRQCRSAGPSRPHGRERPRWIAEG